MPTLTFEYDTPGTFEWNMPTAATSIEVVVVAGGGGGECGTRAGNGEGQVGGQGGGAGGHSTASLLPGDITGPVEIVVGAGGAGGDAVLSEVTSPGVNPDFNRLPGADGAASSFGAFATATGGKGGDFAVSDADAGTGNTGTAGNGKNGGNGAGTIDGVDGGTGTNASGGGGGGGGCNVFVAAGNGGAGGGVDATTGPAGGVGGTPNGTAGANGAVAGYLGTGGAGGGGSGVGGAWGWGGDGGTGIRGSGGGGGGNGKTFGGGIQVEAGDGGRGGHGYVRITVEVPTIYAPDIVGLSAAAANALITGSTMDVGVVTSVYSEVVPAGLVISQNPAAGVEVNAGDNMDYVLSAGLRGEATATTFDDEAVWPLQVGRKLHMKEILCAPEPGTTRRPASTSLIKPTPSRVK